jgi:hypothetical protein
MQERGQFITLIEMLETRSREEVAAWLDAGLTGNWVHLVVREFAALAGLRVEVRAPFYLLHPGPVMTEYRNVTGDLLLECASLGLPTQIMSAGFENVVSARPDRTIRIRFHDHGREQNLWHLKDSHTPGRFYFNETGYSGWLELSPGQIAHIEAPDGAVSRETDAWLQEQKQAPTTKYAQPAGRVGLERVDVFYPLQILDDTVSAHHRVSLIDALMIAVEVTGQTDRRLRVKRHPKCMDDRVKEALRRVSAAAHVEIVDCQVQEALAAADVVLTANSSVGVTALALGKPVVTFGASDYEICTFKAKNSDGLRELLTRTDLTCDYARVRRFFSVFRDELTFAVGDQMQLRQRLLVAVGKLIRALPPNEVQELIKIGRGLLDPTNAIASPADRSAGER